MQPFTETKEASESLNWLTNFIVNKRGTREKIFTTNFPFHCEKETDHNSSVGYVVTFLQQFFFFYSEEERD